MPGISVATSIMTDIAHTNGAMLRQKRVGMQIVSSIIMKPNPIDLICLIPIVNGEPETSYTKLLVVEVTISIPIPLSINGISHNQRSIFIGSPEIEVAVS
jgi:hypothetical protein